MATRWGLRLVLGGGALAAGCVAGQAAPEQPDGDTVDYDDHIVGELACPEASDPHASDAELALNLDADAQVAVDLLGVLGERGDANVMVSPYSLRTAFGQVYAGTSGQSREQIAAVLGFDTLDDRIHDVLGEVQANLLARNAEATDYEPGLVFAPANRTYIDVGIADSVVPAWKQRIQDAYGVCFETFDMNADVEATRQHVNHWVAEQTRDQIPNLVKFLPETVDMIVVNAIYLEASWATPFDEAATRPGDFTTFAGATTQVELMHGGVVPGKYASGEDWEAVALPYTDSRLELVVILPAQGQAAAFEAELTGARLTEVFAALTYTNLDLTLPKFDVRVSNALRTPLTALGMTAPFANAADFAGIAPGMHAIFEVFHDVSMIVDEKGTEAAAATAIVFGEDGGEEPVADVTVRVDRSFYVALRDTEARSVLFFARVGDPSAAQ